MAVNGILDDMESNLDDTSSNDNLTVPSPEKIPSHHLIAVAKIVRYENGKYQRGEEGLKWTTSVEPAAIPVFRIVTTDKMRAMWKRKKVFRLLISGTRKEVENHKDEFLAMFGEQIKNG